MMIECNVWCSEDDHAEEMGMPSGDCWMPMIIKLGSISAIKEAGGNDFIGEGKCTVFVHDRSFIIDRTYKEIAEMFKKPRFLV